MALKKLPKNKADVKFLDPVTFEVKCSYNECYKKFVPDTNVLTWNTRYNDKPTVFSSFFHRCPDCGMKMRSRADADASYNSYHASIFGPGLTKEEVDKHLATELAKMS